MKFTKQEHLSSKHDPKQIPGIIWESINPHPCFDKRNKKQNKKPKPLRNKQVCQMDDQNDPYFINVFETQANTSKSKILLTYTRLYNLLLC